ncbi:hypothetical protein [Leptolyngbya sp. 7M]|uniref:hypothetical protein n=1 Tax=Leptolyngbya sp. 7M TaxID=2812896 RepID=UPI001B8B23DA|nr:hypothetical protein [Leptolyngbya sp. 7M]QYO64535.1 hypothetical protein JVX88_33565 [Leptolyngbya sp. 7M]
MEFWEFLIQKEGDRSWLPLESPSVEILEGRYRVVARSHRANTATEIRVIHYATTETPPVRRVRKRSSQTNPDGLIVILPFTRLQPGLWELRCTGDVMAEMMGENWQYAVQLDVVPQEQPADEWNPDWQGTATETTKKPTDEAVAGTVQAVAEANPTPEVKSSPVPEVTPLAAATEAVPSIDQPVVSPPEEQVNPTPVSETVSEIVDPESSLDQPALPAADLSQALQQIEQASEQLVDSIFRNLTDLTNDVTSETSLTDEAKTGEIHSAAEPAIGG